MSKGKPSYTVSQPDGSIFAACSNCGRRSFAHHGVIRPVASEVNDTAEAWAWHSFPRRASVFSPRCSVRTRELRLKTRWRAPTSVSFAYRTSNFVAWDSNRSTLRSADHPCWARCACRAAEGTLRSWSTVVLRRAHYGNAHALSRAHLFTIQKGHDHHDRAADLTEFRGRCGKIANGS